MSFKLPDTLIAQQPLLDNRTIILPQEFDGSVFPMLHWAIYYICNEYSDADPIIINVTGLGGSADELRACVDLIRVESQHVSIESHLYGGAHSAHAAFWAACPKRVVMPSSFLGIHSASSWDGRMSSRDAVNRMEMLEDTNRFMAKIFAEACGNKNWSPDYWERELDRHQNAIFGILASDLISKYQMGTLWTPGT